MRWMWAGLLASLLLDAGAASAADLRLHGSNTIGERLAPALVEAWLAADGYGDIAQHTTAFEEVSITASRGGETIQVEIHAHGSGTSAKDLIAGTSDIGMSSRAVLASERDAAMAAGRGALDDSAQELVLALDGLSVVVNSANPLDHLDRDTVRRIFAGQIIDWAQLGYRRGPIAVHARDDRSGTWDSFRAMVLGELALTRKALRYESTAALAAAVAADPLAIGFVGMSEVKGVKALAIADGAPPVAPQAFHVAVEDYPLSRRLYLYLPTQASELAQRFVGFALSDPAQAIVERIGFVSQRVRSYPAAARADAPDAYRQMVVGAQRLSLNFRFGSGSSYLDSKAMRDLDRLAQFMARTQGQELRLIGFADASEVVPYSAWSLSNDRADFIAEQLAARRIAVARVRGMGGAVPVATNDNDLGRNRNRRVEVWLAPRQAALSALNPTSSPARPLP